VVPVEIAFGDPGCRDQLTASVNWGDGSAEEIQSGTTSHRYDRAGPYLLHVHVQDSDGAVTDRAADHLIVVYTGYEVIDLGTLGGNTAVPVALNDKGQVVGYSTTASGEEHAFVWENGSMRDLGVSSEWSRAQTMTNSGIIAGVMGGGTGQAFLWNNGVTTALGSAVNREIVVVGMTATRVLTTSGDSEHGPSSALWQNGAWQRLGGLSSGGHSIALAINTVGQVAGLSPVGQIASSYIFHAFLWENGGMRDLGVLADPPCADSPTRNCGWSEAWDINNAGDVVGTSGGSLGSHAVLWPRGGMIRDLGLGRAVAVNDAGEVAGDAGNLNGNAFLWRQGNLTSLPSLGGTRTLVVDLNNLSMVVGNGLTAQGKSHVFVWRPGQPTLLDLGAGMSADEAAPVAVNARGDIIGFTCTGTGGASCWHGASARALLWRVKP
jgi:probable HAF family extracellular repeat protein